MGCHIFALMYSKACFFFKRSGQTEPFSLDNAVFSQRKGSWIVEKPYILIFKDIPDA